MKYLNPITVEAEIFLNSLESLSEHYNNVDTVLLSALEKIMHAIENFLDSAPSEIIESKKTRLVKCSDITQIKRIFSCSFCKRDIGKSVEKVALHIIENCSAATASSKFHNGHKIKTEPKISEERNLSNNELDIKKKGNRKEPKQGQGHKVTKKTESLLTTNLNQFIEDQIKIGTKFKCIPAYDKIEKDLLKLATPLFPNKNVQVYKFGSRIAGIGHRESDLDLYMDIGDTFHVYQHRANNESIDKLRAVEKAIKSDNKSWKGMVTITKARVPILKVIHNETGIECDINFSNSLGVVNTKLLEYIFNLQPIAQSLCCYMKKWLNRSKLFDDINTYSMNLVVIFFLQTLNLIPSLERLQEDIKQEMALKIGHWMCMYATYSLKELNIEKVKLDQPNMLKYIRKFFTFYINFNYNRDVICPYLGKVIKKDDLENLMPSRYIDFITSFPTYKLEVDCPIIVQDPLQLAHNTTKNVSSVESLKENMVKSLQILNDHFLEDVI